MTTDYRIYLIRRFVSAKHQLLKSVNRILWTVGRRSFPPEIFLKDGKSLRLLDQGRSGQIEIKILLPPRHLRRFVVPGVTQMGTLNDEVWKRACDGMKERGTHPGHRRHLWLIAGPGDDAGVEKGHEF